MARGFVHNAVISVFTVSLGAVFSATVFLMFAPHAYALNDLDSGDALGEQYEYIDVDTVWRKNDNLTFRKPVLVDYDTTLTIEAGAHIYLDGGDMTINSSAIVALGTRDEPIIITSHDSASFSVIFQESNSFTEKKTSRLEYVRIRGGGRYTDPSTCGDEGSVSMGILSPIISVAHASGGCLPDVPAVLYRKGRVSFSHTDFIDNRYADIQIEKSFRAGEEDFIRVSASNFGSNAQSTAVIAQDYCVKNDKRIPCGDRADMRGNWWGDKSGPYFDAYFPELSNTRGAGQRIIGFGDVLTGSFASSVFDNGIDCSENCFSNVLFLPGVEASRLYAKDDPDCKLINCENQLWEPNRNEDVKKLYLDKDGKSTDQYDIYTRDIIDETNGAGQNIYKSFMRTMDDLKDDHQITDWAAVPYDWRLSLEDILKGGTVLDAHGSVTYDGTSIAPRIIAELKRLAQSSRSGTVTIVAHSNGGLVAKALMQSMGDDETKRLIDGVVLVGVPQIGTPAAVGAMLHGYDQDLLGGLILSKSVARGLAEHMPSAYTLLPSNAYFDSVQTPVASFDADTVPEWNKRYGDRIDTHRDLQSFLTDTYRRVDATSEDDESPSALDEDLLDAADTRHKLLDNWKAPDGVKVMQIAGWGVPATVSGMHYTTKHSFFSGASDELTEEPVFTVDGDGTVVTPSALWMGDADRYWVDLGSYNDNNPLTTFTFGYVSTSHSDILEISELNDFIADFITHTSKSIDKYAYLNTQTPPADKDLLQYTLHSPLSLDLYDDQGRHTGLDKDGHIEEQIPGTYYRQFGEVKYIFSDAGTHYRIEMNGYDKGTFTLEIESRRGDVSTGKVVFADMPATKQTKATLDVGKDIDTLGNLIIDENGDGSNEYRISPSVGDIVTRAGVIGKAKTIYTLSAAANIKSTVKDTHAKEIKKHKQSVKKYKATKKSKREIRREEKIRKILAARKRAQSDRIKSQISPPIAPAVAPPQEAISDEKSVQTDTSPTPIVEGDSVERVDVVESKYGENDTADAFAATDASVNQRIMDRIHTAWKWFVSLW